MEWNNAAAPDPRVDAAIASGEAFDGRRIGYDHAGLRGVALERGTGALTLRGTVASYYLKQMAQELVRVRNQSSQIINRIEVAR